MFCTPCQILAHQGDHLRDLPKIIDGNNQNQFEFDCFHPFVYIYQL